MTKEEKELLLKDLCARLPYEVKVQYKDDIFTIDYISGIYEEIKLDTPDRYTIDISEVKPYLFPFSSMTEEQKNTFSGKVSILNAFIDGSICLSEDEELTPEDIIELFNFLNKNHFDYRGLIEKGLAEDATGSLVYSVY